MERLTTDQENAPFSCFNIFYAKGGEIWVRGGGPYPEYQDVTLVQWIRSAAQKHGLNIMAEDPEYLGDEMYDALQDGDETIEGIMAFLHAAAVQATEMRERLKTIEDIMGDTYDLDRLRELVEADREGRCEIHAAKDGDTVYSIFAYVNGLHIRKSNGEPITKITSYVVNDFTRNTVDREFMKTVFPTSEAAEQALKECQDG